MGAQGCRRLSGSGRGAPVSLTEDPAEGMFVDINALDPPILRRKTMQERKVGAIEIKSFALLVVLGTA